VRCLVESPQTHVGIHLALGLLAAVGHRSLGRHAALEDRLRRRQAARLNRILLFDLLLLVFLFLDATEVVHQACKGAVPMDEIVIRAGLDDMTVLERVDLVDLREKVESVRDEDDRLAELLELEEGTLKDTRADVRVERRKRVIEGHHVGVKVERARNVDTLTLAACKVRRVGGRGCSQR
jgi:hypothetical protein